MLFNCQSGNYNKQMTICLMDGNDVPLSGYHQCSSYLSNKPQEAVVYSDFRTAQGRC